MPTLNISKTETNIAKTPRRAWACLPRSANIPVSKATVFADNPIMRHRSGRFPLAPPGECAYNPSVNHGACAMTGDLSPIDTAKFVAAKRAVEFVEDGMRVGLGTGSTAAWMVRCLGELVRDEGLKITGVPTSTRTAELARKVGINVVSLDEAKWLDLTIDGADEFDPELNLIKGGGGALLQEKIVATASRPDDRDHRRLQAGRASGRLPAAGRGDAVRLADHQGADRGNAGRARCAGRQRHAAHERPVALRHRRGQFHPRSASAPHRQSASGRAGAEPDPGRGGKRAVHRHLRYRGDRPWRRPGRGATTSTRHPRRGPHRLRRKRQSVLGPLGLRTRRWLSTMICSSSAAALAASARRGSRRKPGRGWRWPRNTAWAAPASSGAACRKS